MPETILIVAATDSEAEIIRKIEGIRDRKESFRFRDLDISVLATGVGTVMTAWKMKQWLSQYPRPSLAINIGIAGTFKEEIETGEVVIPVTDCFADMGIETDSGFITLFEAGLSDPDRFPFRNGWINTDSAVLSRLPKILRQVRAITVNTSSGSSETISRYVLKYNPDIETMEGAAFFYVCSSEKIPFISLRAVSNRIMPRRKGKWDIPAALENLSQRLHEVLLMTEIS